ncbi:MAG: site-specific integrase, partial [Candidatus Berkelbacteria bacterium]|nr:site-specific integrase [Candidatus Berkelbacteria bacterium]
MASLEILKRQFLEHCELERGHASLTIQAYDRYLCRFFDFLHDLKFGREESDKQKERSYQNLSPS